MSTFLELCVDAQRECDITGPPITAVTNQTGELNRLVQWMIQVWKEIQNRHTNWRWMRSRWTLNTTFTIGPITWVDAYAGTAANDAIAGALITRFARWLPFDDRGASNVKIYLSTAGVGTERWMSYLDWSSFIEIYKRGIVPNAPPAHYTIDPQNKLVLGPRPDATYILSGEYMKSAQILAAEGDIPECPPRFHDLLTYMVMQKYAGFESAPEVMSRGVKEGNRVMRQLEADQLPPMALAAPLA